MTKQELIVAIADKANVTRKTADEVLNALSEAVTEALQEGGDITIPGIGKLSVQHKEARTGRNPSTRESIDIPAKNVPKFSAAKALKDAVA